MERGLRTAAWTALVVTIATLLAAGLFIQASAASEQEHLDAASSSSFDDAFGGER